MSELKIQFIYLFLENLVLKRSIATQVRGCECVMLAMVVGTDGEQGTCPDDGHICIFSTFDQKRTIDCNFVH